MIVIIDSSSSDSQTTPVLRRQPSRAAKKDNKRVVAKRVGVKNVLSGSRAKKRLNMADGPGSTEAQTRLAELMEQMELLRAENERLREESMSHQVETLRAENERLRLSRGSSETSVGHGGAATHRVSLRDAEASLPKFRGDDPAKPVAEWVRTMDNKIMAYGWSQLEGYVGASNALEGAAKKWAESCSEVNTWDALKVAIQTEFKARTSKGEIYEIMTARRRKKEESIFDFFQEMKVLGRQADMEEQDVLKYIVRGVTDNEPMRLALYSAETYGDLRKKLNLLSESLTAQGAGKSWGSNNQQKGKKAGEGQNKGQHKGQGDQEPKCFSCGGVGHMRTECPDKDKGPKCYKCNKFGHIKPACLEKDAQKKKST